MKLCEKRTTFPKQSKFESSFKAAYHNSRKKRLNPLKCVDSLIFSIASLRADHFHIGPDISNSFQSYWKNLHTHLQRFKMAARYSRSSLWGKIWPRYFDSNLNALSKTVLSILAPFTCLRERKRFFEMGGRGHSIQALRTAICVKFRVGKISIKNFNGNFPLVLKYHYDSYFAWRWVPPNIISI